MKNTDTINFNKLVEKRVRYQSLEWLSSNGNKIKVIDMKDDYLANALRKVHEKLQVANAYPLVKEFQIWNNIKYSTWSEVFYNELVFRQETEEQEYVKHLELEIHRQSRYDEDYYGSCGEYGDCF